MGDVIRSYLAAEAGQPLSPEAVAGRAAATQQAWADPESLCHEGRRAALFRETAVASLATTFGARPDEIHLFSSGAAAIRAAALGTGNGPLLMGSVESRAALGWAGQRPGGLHPCPVGPTGAVDLGTWRRGVAEAGAAWLQIGNPEVGTAQPVSAAAHLSSEAGIPLILDATMAAGRVELPPDWQVVVVDARSWAAGDGMAAVLVRHGLPYRSPDFPVEQVSAWPTGPTVADLAGAAFGLEAAMSGLVDRSARDRQLTDRIRAEVAQFVPDAVVHGDPKDRLPHIVGLSVLYVDGEALLAELDRRGIAVSSGSACVRDGVPSHVLAATGGLSSGNVRITLPLNVTEESVDHFLSELPAAVSQVRQAAGVVGL